MRNSQSRLVSRAGVIRSVLLLGLVLPCTTALLIGHADGPKPQAIPRLAGFGGFGARHPAISGAFKIRSWGHVFTIIVSSSRTFTPAQYAVNTEPGLALGFNIYRRMR